MILHLSQIFFTDGLTFIYLHLLVPVRYPAAFEVVWRQLYKDLVTGKDPYEILPHFPRDVGQNFMLILVNGDFEHRVWKSL